jgi:hypothetical protein
MALVGVCYDTEKMLPGYPARSETSIALYGAKNEWVSFQIVVQGPGTVDSINLYPPTIIPPGRSQVYRIDEVYLSTRTGGDGFTGWVPDILVPLVDPIYGQVRNALPYTIGGGWLKSFWVDMHIPAGTNAGDYSGYAVVTLDGTNYSVAFTLRVWDFTLPSSSTLRNVFYMRWGVQNEHPTITAQPDIDSLVAAYSTLALDHRMSVSAIDTGNQDLGAFNANFGPLLNGSAQTKLAGAKWTTMMGTGWGASMLSGDPGGAAARSYAQNAINNGWIDRLINTTVDEPEYFGGGSSIPGKYDTMKSINPAYKALVTARYDWMASQGLLDKVDILCPVVNDMWPRGGSLQRDVYNSWLTGGTYTSRELWLYQSCASWGCGSSNDTGWTSYAIDASDSLGRPTGLRHRMMAWLLAMYNCTGELYWETINAYGSNPWSGSYAFGGNGDGTLFYPGRCTGSNAIGGTYDIPLPSLRMKNIRNGYQDWEYLRILKSYGGDIGTMLGSEMFPNPWSVPSHTTFYGNRITLGQQIQALVLGAPTGGNPPTINKITPNAGPESGGTTVTIQGSSFISGTAITFGGTTAQVVSLTSNEIQVITPAHEPGSVTVTASNPNGTTIFLNGYSYTVVTPGTTDLTPVAVPGWPVSASATSRVLNSFDLTVPACPAGRLLCVSLAWNTRGNTNANPVAITGLGLTWTEVVAAEFQNIAPGHEGVQIWAAWATNPVSAGDKIRVTCTQSTIDLLVTGYAFGNVQDGSSNVLDCFAATANVNDPTGASAGRSITLGMTTMSTALFAIVDGSGAQSLAGLTTTHFDAQNNDWVAMGTASLVDSPDANADVTIGAQGSATYYCMAAVEIKAGSPVTPVITAVDWYLGYYGPEIFSWSYMKERVWVPNLADPYAGYYQDQFKSLTVSGRALGNVSATFTVRATPDGPGLSTPLQTAVLSSTDSTCVIDMSTAVPYMADRVTGGVYAQPPGFSSAGYWPLHEAGSSNDLVVTIADPQGHWAAIDPYGGTTSNGGALSYPRGPLVVREALLTGYNFLTGMIAEASVVPGSNGMLPYGPVSETILSMTETSVRVDLTALNVARSPQPENAMVTLINPGGAWATTSGTVGGVIRPPATQVKNPAYESVATADTVTTNPLRRISTIYHPEDDVVNRANRSLVDAIQPIADAVARMPQAEAGVFAARGWSPLLLLNWWTRSSNQRARIPGFTLNSAGEVSLRGIVTGGLIGKPLAVLPPGYRPFDLKSQVVPAGTNGFAIIQVDQDGTVTTAYVPESGQTEATGGTVASIDVYLDGVSFRAEQ